MRIGQSFLPEFDQEMALTRKTLERLPDDKFAWKPHEKSWALGALASHLANIPGWGVMTLELPGLDLAGMQSPQAQTRAMVLDQFETNVKRLRALLDTVPDEALAADWTLRMGEQVIFTLPRGAILRGMVLSHMIHHRAQLGVYFRLNDIPVPSIYGPSADD